MPLNRRKKSISLEQFELPLSKKVAVVFGNEVVGVQDIVMQQSNGCIEIPQHGTKHSLNVSVAAGIVLWKLVHP
jgi:tRNA G18 (ribose-2'-O)-methylase SpoU